MARRRPTEPTANPARGIVLVVVAVLIGLFLLRNGIDTTVSTSGPSGTDGATDVGTDAGDDATTSSTLGVRTPPDVPTIVLNGSGVSGAAKKYSTALQNKGYTLTNPDGDNAETASDTTRVYYVGDFEREALGVAEAIGAPPTAVEALGTTNPGTTAGASVIVVLGKDLGSAEPPA